MTNNHFDIPQAVNKYSLNIGDNPINICTLKKNMNILDKNSMGDTQRSTDYLHSGSPRTSRFLKNLDNSNASFTTHHYNPYLYTQHKTRPNAPFDITHIKNKKLTFNVESKVHQISGFQYILQEGSIPIFRINKEELPDLYDFYELVEPLGEKYGAVKIEIIKKSSNTTLNELPQTTSLNNFSLNTEYFWFKARKQYLNSFKNEIRLKVNFYKKLYKFHKLQREEKDGQGLGKIPSIDKRTLDLYRLRSCVQLRGGFHAVCQKKLWAQIGRELGYSGRIMSSLSTSLRSAYLKVFLDFDNYEIEKEKNNNKTKNASSLELSDSIACVDNSGISKRQIDNQIQKDVASQYNVKKRKLDHVEGVEMGGSCIEYFRMRDILTFKGFETNFNSVTEYRAGLTEPNRQTFPGFNFSLWSPFMEIYDKSSYETKNSPIYNLRQYHEKSQKHYEKLQSMYETEYPDVFKTEETIDLMKFEQLFFNILFDEQISFDIDSGINLPCNVHGSGFNVPSKTNDNIPDILYSWNLNNVSLSEKSLLKYLEVDYSNVTRNKLDVGMLFSVNGWSMEDNFLPMLEYNHLGSSKLWFIIPQESMEEFEELVKEINLGIQERDQEEYINEDDVGFLNSEFYHSYLDTVVKNPVETSSRTIFHELNSDNSKNYNNKILSKSYLFPNELQIPPKILMDRGIKFYRVTQDATSFILKFPKSYTSTISSGFHVSEKANFAPKSWLKYALEGSKWLCNRNVLPAIPTFVLLMSIYTQSENSDIIMETKKILIPLIKKELINRENFGTLFKTPFTIYNTFDFISDEKLEHTGASKVVLTTSNDCFTISLNSFLEQIKIHNGEKYLFDNCISDDSVKVTLHVCYTDTFLQKFLIEENQSSLQNDTSSSYDTKQLLKHLCTEEFSTTRIPLIKFQELFEKVGNDNDTVITEIREYIDSISYIIEECKHIIERIKNCNDSIDFGKGFRIKDLSHIHLPCKLNEIIEMSRKLNHLSVEFPEMQEFLKKVNLFNEFQEKARESLNKIKNINTLKRIYQMGLSIGIESKYFTLLYQKICESLWLETFEDFFVNNNVSLKNDHENYNLPLLYHFLKIGIKYVDHKKHMAKLEFISNVIKVSQNIMERLNKFFSKKYCKVPITELEDILEIITTKNIPINPIFINGLKSIIFNIRTAKKDIELFTSQLSVNDKYITDFENNLEKKDPKIFELFPKYNGSSHDKRMTLEEIAIQPDLLIFTKHIKICKNWLQELNKVIPNSKNNLDNIIDYNNHCFDIENDDFNLLKDSDECSFYCFCRKGDIGDTMIECEICKEWFHLNCINSGKWALPKEENTVFVCNLCYPTHTELLGFIKFNDLIRLLISSVKLKVIPERKILKKLFEVAYTTLKFYNFIITELFEHGKIKQHSSIKKVKFYLRKLQGSKCHMIEEMNILKNYCRHHDATELDTLLSKNQVVITGFETLTKKQKELETCLYTEDTFDINTKCKSTSHSVQTFHPIASPTQSSIPDNLTNEHLQ